MQAQTSQLHRFHNITGIEEISYQIITPEEAAFLLTFNTHNRKPSPLAVKNYTAEMNAGQWKVTCQGIGFGADGVLQDGQQRLMSIVASKKSIKIAVATGLVFEAQSKIDGGKVRSLPEQLRLAGREIETVIVRVANTLARHATPRKGENWVSSVTDQEIRSILDVNDVNLTTLAKEIDFKNSSKKYCKVGFLAAIIQYMDKDTDAAIEFFRQTTAVAIQRSSAADRMRTYLGESKKRNQQAVQEDYEKALTLIHCFHFQKDAPLRLHGQASWEF